jgi:hypothetical protein
MKARLSKMSDHALDRVSAQPHLEISALARAASGIDQGQFDREQERLLFTSSADLRINAAGLNDQFQPIHMVIGGRLDVRKQVFHANSAICLRAEFMVGQQLNPLEVLAQFCGESCSSGNVVM